MRNDISLNSSLQSKRAVCGIVLRRNPGRESWQEIFLMSSERQRDDYSALGHTALKSSKRLHYLLSALSKNESDQDRRGRRDGPEKTRSYRHPVESSGCARPVSLHHLLLTHVLFTSPSRHTGRITVLPLSPTPGSGQFWSKQKWQVPLPDHSTLPFPTVPILAICAMETPQDGRSWEG